MIPAEARSSSNEPGVNDATLKPGSDGNQYLVVARSKSPDLEATRKARLFMLKRDQKARIHRDHLGQVISQDPFSVLARYRGVYPQLNLENIFFKASLTGSDQQQIDEQRFAAAVVVGQIADSKLFPLATEVNDDKTVSIQEVYSAGTAWANEIVANNPLLGNKDFITRLGQVNEGVDSLIKEVGKIPKVVYKRKP